MDYLLFFLLLINKYKDLFCGISDMIGFIYFFNIS